MQATEPVWIPHAFGIRSYSWWSDQACNNNNLDSDHAVDGQIKPVDIKGTYISSCYEIKLKPSCMQ